MWNLFKRKKRSSARTQGLNKDSNLFDIAVSFDPTSGVVSVLDLEGEEWVLRRSETGDGDILYLSGIDGTVQAQFSGDALRTFLKFAVLSS